MRRTDEGVVLLDECEKADPEILETRLPVRLDQFAIRRGSGGPGAHHGGDGVIRAVTFLEPMRANILANRRRVAPRGIKGGSDAQPGRNWVERTDGSVEMLSATAFAEIEALKRQVVDANLEADRMRRDAEELKRTAARQAQEAMDQFKAAYPKQLRFPYVFKARSKPFRVTAIYHDDRFTYIHVEAKELPAVYEVVDNVPNLIGFQVERGVYVIPKVLEHGYLAIGKQRLPFDVAGR